MRSEAVGYNSQRSLEDFILKEMGSHQMPSNELHLPVFTSSVVFPTLNLGWLCASVSPVQQGRNDTANFKFKLSEGMAASAFVFWKSLGAL